MSSPRFAFGGWWWWAVVCMVLGSRGDWVGCVSPGVLTWIGLVLRHPPTVAAAHWSGALAPGIPVCSTVCQMDRSLEHIWWASLIIWDCFNLSFSEKWFTFSELTFAFSIKKSLLVLNLMLQLSYAFKDLSAWARGVSGEWWCCTMLAVEMSLSMTVNFTVHLCWFDVWFTKGKMIYCFAAVFSGTAFILSAVAVTSSLHPKQWLPVAAIGRCALSADVGRSLSLLAVVSAWMGVVDQKWVELMVESLLMSQAKGATQLGLRSQTTWENIFWFSCQHGKRNKPAAAGMVCLTCQLWFCWFFFFFSHGNDGLQPETDSILEQFQQQSSMWAATLHCDFALLISWLRNCGDNSKNNDNDNDNNNNKINDDEMKDDTSAWKDRHFLSHICEMAERNALSELASLCHFWQRAGSSLKATARKDWNQRFTLF